MSKITKKSVNELMKVYDKNHVDGYILKLMNPQDDNSVIMEITVKNHLSIAEKGLFADRVAYACFDSEGNYLPQYFEPLFAITLLQMTTNIPVFEINTTDDDGEAYPVMDIGRTYELCKAVNLSSQVTDADYQEMIVSLRHLCEEKIEYLKRVNLRKATNTLLLLRPVIEELANTLTNTDFTTLMETVVSQVNGGNNREGKIISFHEEKK